MKYLFKKFVTIIFILLSFITTSSFAKDDSTPISKNSNKSYEEKYNTQEKKHKDTIIFKIILVFIILSSVICDIFSKEDEKQEKNNENITKRIRTNKDTKISKQNNWLMIKEHVLNKYGEKCVSCGSIKNIDIHHKIPLSEGGTNCLNNLIPLCRSCHEELHRFKLEQQKNTTINTQYGNKISKDKKSKIGYKICNAIENNYRIKIKYKSGKANNEKITERIIQPLEIKLGCECKNDMVQNSKYDQYKKFLRAFCELRNEERLFRIDRIIDVIEEYKG